MGFLAALPFVHLAASHPRPGRFGWSTVVEATFPHFRTYAALLGATALYLAARMAVSGPAAFALDNAISPARHIDTVGQHVLVVLTSIGQHVSSALWPFQNLVPGRQLPLPIRLGDVLPMVAASSSVILAAAAAAFTSPPPVRRRCGSSLLPRPCCRSSTSSPFRRSLSRTKLSLRTAI